MHWRILLLLTFLTVVGNRASSQVNRIAEKELSCARLHAKIVDLHYSDPDSAAIYSDRFEKEFQRLITSKPATFDYKFSKLVDSNFCFIRMSPDKNLKIYSWDTWLGGTMHEFRTIYQWRHNGVIYSENRPVNGDIGSYCSGIYNVTTGGKSYYLVITNAIFSNKDHSQTITAYTINGNKLEDKAPIFHTNGNALSAISINFDFSSVADRPERPLQLIVYNESSRTLYIPFVGKSDQLTPRKFIYQLTEKGFEYTGMR
ncbi:hypothetical protein [Niabella hibiscisoli]|uniref:hypothetical protein n=1 Tax=Niabella hibiscisoli TaxID=1825928 RepID=UPI001F0F877D|nr:hypothetical protein [Niabella hibiscisoli]MCH5716734.1 hypothetical protein [Niabella hibiscisoli]